MDWCEKFDSLTSLNGNPATLYNVLFPLTQNNGALQPPERLAWAEQTILRYSHGLTRHYPATGLCVSPPNVYRDQISQIQAVVAPGSASELFFTQFAAQAAHVFEQESIFVIVQPVWAVGRSLFSTLPTALPLEVKNGTGGFDQPAGA